MHIRGGQNVIKLTGWAYRFPRRMAKLKNTVFHGKEVGSFYCYKLLTENHLSNGTFTFKAVLNVIKNIAQ